MTLVPAPFCTCAPKTFHNTAEPLKHHRTLCRCWKWWCSRCSKCLRAFTKHVKHVPGCKISIKTYRNKFRCALLLSHGESWNSSTVHRSSPIFGFTKRRRRALKTRLQAFQQMPPKAWYYSDSFFGSLFCRNLASRLYRICSLGIILQARTKKSILKQESPRAKIFDQNTECKAQRLSQKIPCIFPSVLRDS